MDLLDCPGSPTLTRLMSEPQRAINMFEDESKHLVDDLIHIHSDVHGIHVDSLKGEAGLPDALIGCVFVGHTATDMDSIASAIGAAELFDGVAARASDINSETQFALEYWNVEVPRPFLEVVEDRNICLVDHNQMSQMAEGVDMKRIRGCIDHHALQSGTIVTDIPIYVKIRAWGSACTIIADMFVRRKQKITIKSAGMLLCGILSDTLNLQSPTTTIADQRMLAVLAKISNVDNIDKLAKQMFRAKSKHLLTLSAHGILNGDLKFFTFKIGEIVYTIAFGVVETVAPKDVLIQTEALMIELRALKKEKNAQFAFLAVVDILNQTSQLLVCGHAENELIQEAYEGINNTKKNTVVDLKSLVSRKLQFIPPIACTLQKGWTPTPELINQDSVDIGQEEFGKIVFRCTNHGCMTKREYIGSNAEEQKKCC